MVKRRGGDGMEMGRRGGERRERWGEGGCEGVREGERREREGGIGGTRRITDNTFQFFFIPTSFSSFNNTCVC